ncbi:NnrU family protein [Qipengyuania sp. G39]|uniref:NnrU family protein n=1 Tax=Qipengyuania profundimaris TaxID=3067652 RepID=A0ABT9HL49_9SPHN|nr:NnrU family protein [Qipengyuania sp. G39]MDP4573877.1 NnrU family protein [Qipengyuania sp. G39]
MDQALVSLLAASVALVGTHFALSHPLRAPLVSALREGGFMLVYNAVAIACMVWMYLAFKDAPSADLGGSGELGWAVATLLTLPALALFLGAMTPRNPAMPTPGAEAAARAGPAGAFLVTRHPMMWGFALWALSHIVLWWSMRTLIVAGAILVLALVGAKLQDAKKRSQMGDAWLAWEAETSFVPRLSKLGALGWKGWLAALLAWGVLMWVHLPLGGIPAGVFRWV